MNTHTFQIGQTVSYGFYGDNHYETRVHFKVISRSAKFVTLEGFRGETYRVKIREAEWAKGEYCFPYSYASSAIYASSAVEVEQ